MTVDEYLKLPYAVDIHWDSDDKIFVARVAEITECSGHGHSRSEAMDMALDNLRDWIEDALEAKEAIPQPAPIKDLPSGKWVQRVPRSVHAELVALAAKDDVSLNQLVVSMISRELGYRAACTDSNQVREIEASCVVSTHEKDPSTDYWNLVRNEIAVVESWQIQGIASSVPVNPAYLHRLVSALPPFPQTLKINEPDNQKYDNDKNHERWN